MGESFIAFVWRDPSRFPLHKRRISSVPQMPLQRTASYSKQAISARCTSRKKRVHFPCVRCWHTAVTLRSFVSLSAVVCPGKDCMHSLTQVRKEHSTQRSLKKFFHERRASLYAK